MSDPSRVEALFFAALDRPPADRAAFLDQACAADRPLRAGVDRLLAAQPYVREFLEGLPPTVAAAPADGPSVDLAGTVIGGRYKLLEPIGEGGMGEVWVADQAEPVRRHVALKLIKAGMDSRSVLARFEAERQALAMMDHPNIAKVLDAGTTGDGRPFFVMELVKGTPITEFCDARRVPTRERLELFILVCQAIQHAHAKGIIHRDVKPGNVLVALYDERSVPKVIDFGVAKAVSQRLTEKTLYTGFGTLVGTPAYMAPEQATFNQLDTDTRADVYALGVLLYELLTGGPPFDLERLQQAGLDEVLRVVREEDPPRPSARLSTARAKATIAADRRSDPARLERLVRGDLDWIVMKCLEKDRNRRYDTAAELARDVERYLRDEPVLACPPSPLYRARKIVRRHRAAALATGLAAFALLLATGVSGWFATKAGAAAEAAGEQAKEAKDAAGREATEKEQAWRHLYVARMQTAQWAWREGNLPQLRYLLEETQPAAGQPDLRGFEWHYFNRLAHAEPLTVRYPAGISSVLLSPDGRLFVTAGTSDRFDAAVSNYVAAPVTVYDTATGKAVRTLPDAHGSPTVIAVAPAGWRVARTAGHHTVEVWDLAAGRLEARLEGTDLGAHSLAFSRDGKRLATGGSGEKDAIRIWDIATGKVLQVLAGHGSFVYELTFSPDGKLLASAGHDRTIRISDAETGRPVREINAHHRIVSAIAFSPDGARLAGTSGQHVRVWDAGTGEEVRLLSGHQGTVSAVAFSPDGKRLATAGRDRTVRVWDLETGREAAVYKGHADHVVSVVFTPDGKRLVSGGRDRTVRLWDATANPEVQLLNGSRTVAFSPDGRFLVTGEGEKGVVLRDAASGRERFRLDSRAHGMTFSRDGSRLVTFHGGYVGDRPARVWDTGTGKVVVQLEGDADGEVRVSDMTYSPDGRWLAAFLWAEGGGTIQVWDAATGRRARTIGGRLERAGSPVFSPDGGRLAASLNDRVTEWDAATGAELRSLVLPAGQAGAVTYSPDGRWLAAAANQADGPGDVIVWDRATGRVEFTLRGHTETIFSVAFSPDSRRLAASVGGYGAWIESASVVRVWELTTGQEVLGVIGGYTSVQKVVFSPDGHRLACSGFDGVRIWDATPRADAGGRPAK
jgi:eukaryotic-like serine/threonine-protein kinase